MSFSIFERNVVGSDNEYTYPVTIVNHYTIRCADHDVDGPGIVHTGEDVCFWARGPGWTNHPVDLGEVEMNFFLNKHGHCALDISRNVKLLTER